MKAADRSGARFAVLIGAEERKTASVRIRDLESGEQLDVAANAAADWLKEKLGLGRQA